MTETISIFVTFLAAAILYEFLKPAETQSDEKQDGSNAEEE